MKPITGSLEITKMSQRGSFKILFLFIEEFNVYCGIASERSCTFKTVVETSRPLTSTAYLISCQSSDGRAYVFIEICTG